MDDSEKLELQKVGSFGSDVSIFRTTLAKDIPKKLNAIAVSLKDYFNNTLVDILNLNITKSQTFINDLTTQFKENMSEYLHSSDIGYTTNGIHQILLEDSFEITMVDGAGRPYKYKEGNKEYKHMIYQGDTWDLISYESRIVVDGIGSSWVEWEVRYNANGDIESISKV